MNPTEALTLTRIVKAAFPAQRFDEFTIDVWADALKHEDFGACREAITRLVTRQTFASVAEIIAETKAHRRDAYRALRSRKVLGELEAARTSTDRKTCRRGYEEASRMVAEALAAKHAGEIEEAS